MILLLSALYNNVFYFASVVLFVIGFYTMLVRSNLIKKLIGLNVMETGVFLLFVSLGYVEGGLPPIVDHTNDVVYVNPLPTALILTGIVVAVSVTAFSLALCVKLYRYYGTLDADEIMQRRSAPK